MKQSSPSENTEISSSTFSKLPVREKRTLKFTDLTDNQKSLLNSAVSGLAGVSVGVVGLALMGWVNKESIKEGNAPSNVENRKTGGNDMEVPIYSDAPFSDAVTDDMSFGEAFQAARADVGPGGFFEYNGKTYNTYYKEEWDALTPEQKKEFISSVDDQHEDSQISDIDEILVILNDDTDIKDVEEMDHEDIIIDDNENFLDPDLTDDDIVILDAEEFIPDHDSSNEDDIDIRDLG